MRYQAYTVTRANDGVRVGAVEAQSPEEAVFRLAGGQWGRDAQGRGAYVKLCTWPDRPRRRHLHYNGQVQHGWRLKRDAQAVAAQLNGKA